MYFYHILSIILGLFCLYFGLMYLIKPKFIINYLAKKNFNRNKSVYSILVAFTNFIIGILLITIAILGLVPIISIGNKDLIFCLLELFVILFMFIFMFFITKIYVKSE